MSAPRSVTGILRQHVTLEVECLDRMYLKVYVPQLQTERGVAAFFRYHRGHPFASSALMEPISKAFIRALEAFAAREQGPLVSFARKQSKDDVMVAPCAFSARGARVSGIPELTLGWTNQRGRPPRELTRENRRAGGMLPWPPSSSAPSFR